METRFALALTLAALFVASCERDEQRKVTLTSETVSGPTREATEVDTTDQVSADDQRVTGRVRTSLISEGLTLPLDRVTIVTHDGIVTLKGKVKSRESRIRAGTIAEQTAGVSGVNNQLLYDRP